MVCHWSLLEEVVMEPVGAGWPVLLLVLHLLVPELLTDSAVFSLPLCHFFPSYLRCVMKEEK
jgi:hypothetical protein